MKSSSFFSESSPLVLMRTLLSALIAVTLTALCFAAEDGPTVEQVSANPSKFEGKTIVFKGVEVSGKLVEGPVRYRLTVKSKDGTTIHSKMNKDGINFAIPKSKAPELTKGWKENESYPATLSCKIEKDGKGHWFAMVEKVDLANQQTVPKGDTKTATVTAEGVGKTHDDALKDAFRNAVRQVVGAMVDAETIVKNDQIISDKVLTYSAGIVKKYEEVSKKDEKGLVRVKIKATVEQTELVAKLKAANVTIRDVDGKGIFAGVVTDLERAKDARDFLAKAMAGFPHNCLHADPPDKPEIKKKDATEVTFQIAVKLQTNQKTYNQFATRLQKVLDGIARGKGEITVLAEKKGDEFAFQTNLITSEIQIKRKDGMIAVALNTQHTKTLDRTEWKYYILDESCAEVLDHCMQQSRTLKISLLNSKQETVANDRVPLVWKEHQGEISMSLILRIPPHSKCYAISPLFLQNATYYWVHYQEKAVVRREMRLSLDEIKSVSKIACELIEQEEDEKKPGKK